MSKQRNTQHHTLIKPTSEKCSLFVKMSNYNQNEILDISNNIPPSFGEYIAMRDRQRAETLRSPPEFLSLPEDSTSFKEMTQKDGQKLEYIAMRDRQRAETLRSPPEFLSPPEASTSFKEMTQKDGQKLRQDNEDSDSDKEIIVIKPKKPSQKRGRPPSSQKKDAKIWDDVEIFALIEKWSVQELLYNQRHKEYFNKVERAKALDRLQRAVKEDGVDVTAKQISEKLTNLKTYYGAECGKVKASKKSGTGTDSVYEPTWKFFDVLDFLADSFIPRPTKSNLPNEEDSIYEVANPPKAKRSLERNDTSGSAEKVLQSAAHALHTLNERKQHRKEPSEDHYFCEMIRTMLEKNPESQEKAMLKLHIQQEIIKVQYAGPRGSFSPPLDRGPLSPPSQVWTPYN